VLQKLTIDHVINDESFKNGKKMYH